MTIRTILTTKGADVVTARSDVEVGAVVKLLANKRIGAIPIVDHGTIKGIFSERDLIYALAHDGDVVLKRQVSDFMTSPAMTVAPETSVLEALSLMTRRRMRHLPVVDGGNLIGFVSIGDLVKHRIDLAEAEASVLRDYIQTA
jgi:CBS domain-containing protein